MLSKKQTGVIAILLGASLAVGWFDGQSSRNSPRYEKPNPTDQHTNTKPAEIRPDERIANYTWWLAVLTGALVMVSLGQGFFLLRSNKTARMAAIAAQKSADFIPAIERSYVFMQISYFTFQLTPVQVGTERSKVYSLSVRFNFINHGKTPAIIRELRAGIKRLKSELPPNAWKAEDIVPLGRKVLGSEYAYQPQIDMGDDPLAEADGGLILNSALFVYFFGHLAYEDVFGNSHETQFCWRLSQGCFEEWGGKAHNFRT
jgi:hypothetical protein